MRPALALLAALSLAAAALAQITENPLDPSGIAILHPRVRLIHSHDPELEGTTAWLRQNDPFLLYQLGRDLVNRQYEREHGVLGSPGTLDVPLYVSMPERMAHGVPARFAREHSASCGMCHSSVYREPSAGQTIASTGGIGRNTPHFYGAGLVEMIGEQIRRQVLNLYDTDGDELIDRREATGERPVRIRPLPGAPEIDYGDLSPGADGVPQLNNVFRLWFVGEDGRVIPDAFGFDDQRVVAFGFAVQPFGWGRGRAEFAGRALSQGGEASTGREFFGLAANDHMGLQAHDPTQMAGDPAAAGFGGLAGVSLSGARQFDFGGSPDRGLKLDEHGVSLDDPDRDGHLAELTEGDLDAIEFFLLHLPAPAVMATPQSEAGRPLLAEVGCTRCHVESWQIEPRDEALGFAGDRRLFRLAVSSRSGEDGVPELAGELIRLDRIGDDGRREPRGEGFVVERIYSDFRHWNIGPAFWERRFDGSVQREHRTSPLWGVANTRPFGHSGGFMTLEEVILAHGGEAQRERAAFAAMPVEKRRQLLAYLRSLVLFASDEIPADIDGDGVTADELVVAERKMGYERFDARFLFAHLPAWEVMGRVTHANGRSVPFAKVTNIDQAYGLDLEYRRDSDGDGFPDRIDPVEAPPPAADQTPQDQARPDAEQDEVQQDERPAR